MGFLWLLTVSALLRTISSLPAFFDLPSGDFIKPSGKMNQSELEAIAQTLEQMARLAEIRYRGISDLVVPEDMNPVHENVIKNTLVSISGDQPGVSLVTSRFLYQGDILLTRDQAETLLKEAQEDLFGSGFSSDLPIFDNILKKRVKRKMNNDNEKLWFSDRPILYTISPELDTGKPKKAIEAAIKEWEKHTCLWFERRYDLKKEDDYLEFFRGGGCYSMIGRVGGRQQISIGNGCDYTGVVAHEIGHALGFWHEQSRPTRDEFVTINFDNIFPGLYYNFVKQTPETIRSYGVPFDLGSVMMYGPQAFTTDWSKNTITTKFPGFQKTIGQRQTLSFYDAKTINQAYCKNVCRYGDWNPCDNGGYINTNTCNSCECPDGFGGYYCSQNEAPKNANCGGVIWLDGRNQYISSPGYPSPGFQVDQKCSWLIQAPRGKIAFLEFVDQFHFICQVTCHDYVEVRNGTDLANTGMRYCCDQKPTKRIYGSSHKMVIIFKSTLHADVGFKARLNYWPDDPWNVHQNNEL